ncbi:hypothetical protein BGX30_006933 [Mortierella sp. GBA39]|nr:hypothetical protein BGX30_006933 [Mortierella sp. GBA39]
MYKLIALLPFLSVAFAAGAYIEAYCNDDCTGRSKNYPLSSGQNVNRWDTCTGCIKIANDDYRYLAVQVKRWTGDPDVDSNCGGSTLSTVTLSKGQWAKTAGPIACMQVTSLDK